MAARAILGPCRFRTMLRLKGIRIPAMATVTFWCSTGTTAGSTSSTNSFAQKNGDWKAASAAVWDLLNYEQRPYTWTSADAAGLPGFRRTGAI